jgi:hypothetical protein
VVFFRPERTGAGNREEIAMPDPRALPDRPNLTNLRKQAKSLLTAWRAADDRALATVRAFHPQRDRQPAVQPSLADAQLVLAREYGFASWARLVHYVQLKPAARALYTMDSLFRTTLPPADQTIALGDLLERRADLVWQGHHGGPAAVAEFLRAAAGQRRYEQAVADGLTLDQVRTAVAREHGFRDWAGVMVHRDRPVDPRFEAAVDAIVAGETTTLAALLRAFPALVEQRSPFGHRALLIHYVAANGVEMNRQWQSPPNAVEVLRVLLHHGAAPDALCDTYGGGPAQTPLCLLVSSVHPADAGVQADLVTELCRGGANPNGVEDDGLPLWTAITFGYTEAAAALARGGARVDNIVYAAALGNLSQVAGFLRDGSDWNPAGGIRGFNPDHVIEYALIYAAAHGHGDVVELLLTTGPDLSVTEPVFHSTALGAARYHGRADLVALLERG